MSKLYNEAAVTELSYLSYQEGLAGRPEAQWRAMYERLLPQYGLTQGRPRVQMTKKGRFRR